MYLDLTGAEKAYLLLRYPHYLTGCFVVQGFPGNPGRRGETGEKGANVSR